MDGVFLNQLSIEMFTRCKVKRTCNLIIIIELQIANVATRAKITKK